MYKLEKEAIDAIVSTYAERCARIGRALTRLQETILAATLAEYQGAEEIRVGQPIDRVRLEQLAGEAPVRAPHKFVADVCSYQPGKAFRRDLGRGATDEGVLGLYRTCLMIIEHSRNREPLRKAAANHMTIDLLREIPPFSNKKLQVLYEYLREKDLLQEDLSGPRR